VKALNADWTRIAVLSSVDSLETAAGLTKCAIKLDLNLRIYAIKDVSDLLKTLEASVEENDVLLATADTLVYNSRTVKNILLTAYRHRRPVIGYSESFVQAGAVAAIHASPETVGRKAAEIIAHFFDNNWQFGSNVYYIDEFSVSINKQVATSLELRLPDAESVRRTIRKMEAER
jgi:ABC-type uncharacterized transport system substrate-binding protein